MANISVSYTFTNGTTADATEVNTNFQDIIDGTSDGTKDFSINALTCAGTATLNGAVNLGNATSDDITVTGRFASDLDPKTAASNTLGDATQTWRALYLDNTTTDSGAIYFNAGITEYLKGAADGSYLDVGGFTYVDFLAGGVKFQSGATLQAYEEDETGIATGDLTNDTGGGSITGVSVACGRVMKVGRKVTIWLQADFEMTSSAGKLRVALPYTADSSPRQVFTIPCRANNAGAGNGTGLIVLDTSTSAAYALIGPDITATGGTFNTGANSTVGMIFEYMAAT